MRRALLAIFALAVIAAGGLWWHIHTATAVPDLPTLLQAPNTAMELSLLGAARDDNGTPLSQYQRKEDFYAVPALRELQERLQQNDDGSMTADYFRVQPAADHAKSSADPVLVLTLVYGPASPADTRPHLIHATSFGDDGKTIASDVTFNGVTGSRVHASVRDAQGNYINSTYFADGQAVDEEDTVGHDVNGTDQLQTVRRFFPNRQLAALSVLNSDSSRTMTEFDTSTQVLKVTHTGSGYNQTDGESVLIYYPGTKQLRVQSTTTSSSTSAKFFRLDGTVECTWDMSRYTLTVICFDATGTKPVLERDYTLGTFTSQTVNAVEVDKQSWTLTQIKEKRPDGEDAVTVRLTDGKVDQVTRMNVTIHGVKYARVEYDYRLEDSVLTKILYSVKDGTISKIETPNRPEDVKSTLPAADFVLDTSDNLPLPPASYGYGGYGEFCCMP